MVRREQSQGVHERNPPLLKVEGADKDRPGRRAGGGGVRRCRAEDAVDVPDTGTGPKEADGGAHEHDVVHGDPLTGYLEDVVPDIDTLSRHQVAAVHADPHGRDGKPRHEVAGDLAKLDAGDEKGINRCKCRQRGDDRGSTASG